MSELTREERLAQGWRECWGTYHSTGKQWWCFDITEQSPPRYKIRPNKRWRRFNYETQQKARECSISTETVRRFWRRKPQKPAPAFEAQTGRELRVGDRVRVEFDGVIVHAWSDGTFSVVPENQDKRELTVALLPHRMRRLP